MTSQGTYQNSIKVRTTAEHGTSLLMVKLNDYGYSRDNVLVESRMQR